MNPSNCICGQEKDPQAKVCSKCEVEILDGAVHRLAKLKKEITEQCRLREAAWKGINDAAIKGSLSKERLDLVELMMRAGQDLCPLCGNPIKLTDKVAPYDTGLPTYEYYWECPSCKKESKRYVLRSWDELHLTKNYLKMDFLVSIINEHLSETKKEPMMFDL